MKRLILFLFLVSAARAQNTAKFPGAVPTTADLGVASNRAETALTSGINATATSIPVASSSGFKAGSFVTIDSEILAVCAIPDGNHLNVGVSSCPNVDGRGTDTANGGGAAASHLAAAKVQARIVAWNINQPAAELIALTNSWYRRGVSVRTYGAKCDAAYVAGSPAGTDDTVAFQNALAFAGTLTNGRNGQQLVEVPSGMCLVNAQLVVPDGVYMEGQGARATEIVAGASFPGATAMVRIGNGTGYVFSAGVRHLSLNLAQKANSIGVYSTDAQEGAGVQDVVVTGYQGKCIVIDGSTGAGVSNTLIRDAECLPGNAAGTTGIEIKSSSWKHTVQNVSIVASGSYRGTKALNISNAKVNINGLHMEQHDDGLYIDTSSDVSADMITGEGATNTVRIAGSSWVRLGVIHQAGGMGSTILRDDGMGFTSPDNVMVGWFKEGSWAWGYTNGLLTVWNASGQTVFTCDPTRGCGFGGALISNANQSVTGSAAAIRAMAQNTLGTGVSETCSLADDVFASRTCLTKYGTTHATCPGCAIISAGAEAGDHPLIFQQGGIERFRLKNGKMLVNRTTDDGTGKEVQVNGAVSAGGYYIGGASGMTSVVTVKGSAGANCTITFVSGLATATTCP